MALSDAVAAQDAAPWDPNAPASLDPFPDQPYQAPPPQGLPPAQVASFAPPPVSAAPPPPNMSMAPPPAPQQGIAYRPPGGAPPGPVPPQPGGLSPADLMRLAGQQGGGATRAGFQPTTRSAEGTDSPVRGDLLDARTRQMADERAAAGAQFDAETAGGAVVRKAADIQAAYDQAQALQDKVRADQQQSELGAYRDHINTLMKDASDNTMPTDKLWGNATVAQKIAGTIGIALQGFVWGMTGHGPSPSEVINSQIKRNADEQAAKAAQRRQAVGDAQSVYEFNKQALGDEDRARLGTEAAQRQSVIATLQRQVSDAQAPAAVRARAATLQADLSKSQAETLQQMDQLTQRKVSTSERYQQAQGGAESLLARLKTAGEIKDAIARVEGSDLPTQEKKAQIAKLQSEAGGSAAAGSVATGLESAGVPGSEAALQRIDQLLAKGAADRSVLTLGAPRAGTAAGTALEGLPVVGGIVHGVNGMLAGADARELDHQITQLAQMQAHAEGAKGEEGVARTKETIMGNGTREDIQRGIENARRIIAARRTAVEAGASPQAAEAFEARRRAAGVAPPTGFLPAVEQ